MQPWPPRTKSSIAPGVGNTNQAIYIFQRCVVEYGGTYIILEQPLGVM